MTELYIVQSDKSSSDEHEDRIRENLFLLPKQAIKARSYTYRQLAEQMDMRELSIKCLFTTIKTTK